MLRFGRFQQNSSRKWLLRFVRERGVFRVELYVLNMLKMAVVHSIIPIGFRMKWVLEENAHGERGLSGLC